MRPCRSSGTGAIASPCWIFDSSESSPWPLPEPLPLPLPLPLPGSFALPEPLPLLEPFVLFEDLAFFEPLVLVEILQGPGSARPPVALDWPPAADVSGVATHGSLVPACASAPAARPASIRAAIIRCLIASSRVRLDACSSPKVHPIAAQDALHVT
ncbi:MAG: hypothetical protein FIB04_04600 [Gammaproteobacteria bacterium]|nr:hypothetical protein [Gammaproteobacteria bacterium]